jgi:hypothetical protein
MSACGTKRACREEPKDGDDQNGNHKDISFQMSAHATDVC